MNSGVTKVPCARGQKRTLRPCFHSEFCTNCKNDSEICFSFELLINRGLEKNNEGERLTKQETKKSGEISDAFRIWQKEAASESLGAKPQPPEAKGVWEQSPQPPTDLLGFYEKNTYFSDVFLSKKDTPVSEILTTRIGIHNNARAKGGAMAPWSPLRAPI